MFSPKFSCGNIFQEINYTSGYPEGMNSVIAVINLAG